MQSLEDSVKHTIKIYQKILRLIQKDDFKDLYEETNDKIVIDGWVRIGEWRLLKEWVNKQGCLNLWSIRRLRRLGKKLSIERYYSLSKDKLLIRIKETISEQNRDDCKHYFVV